MADRPAGPRHHHHVYVVELSDRVWNEASFRRSDPDCDITRPFLYVGMTGLASVRPAPAARDV
jgi:hypothetical protein